MADGVPDILVEIHYTFIDPLNHETVGIVIYTNAKESALDEILSNWCQDQMFTQL